MLLKEDQGKAHQAKGTASTETSKQKELDVGKVPKTGQCGRNIMSKDKRSKRSQ